jgi:putative redox protein
MIAFSDWKHGNVFEGVSENGNKVAFDADPARTHGPSPMEVVLMALCSCTSVDVVSILKKKRQTLTGLRVMATATRAETAPRVFTRIMLTYVVHGRLSRKAVEDAVALSKNKYCSVSKMSHEWTLLHPVLPHGLNSDAAGGRGPAGGNCHDAFCNSRR